MLKFFSKFLKTMERWEYCYPSNFWFCTITVYFCFTTFFNYLPSFSQNSSQAQIVIQKVRSGGSKQHELFNSVDNLVKKKDFKEMQFEHFPDFESRVSMEKQQAIIYKKTVKKIKEYRRIFLLLNNYQKLLTAEEKLSIDYFQKTGMYAEHQDPKNSPNIHDTRQTFLKKMENHDMLEKFLKSYNRINSIE